MPGPPPAHGKPGSRSLMFGDPLMRGEDVGYAQRFIGRSKCGPDDGVYGHHTEDGVRWYQGDQGLVVDGVCGPKTWARIGVV
jgi:peptidoglycan hydrolase-like protein with peptidoglycan-binding domain